MSRVIQYLRDLGLDILEREVGRLHVHARVQLSPEATPNLISKKKKTATKGRASGFYVLLRRRQCGGGTSDGQGGERGERCQAVRLTTAG